MSNIFVLVFSIILIITGFRYYSYCLKNFESNDQRSKNLVIAVLIIGMGLILSATWIIALFIKE